MFGGYTKTNPPQNILGGHKMEFVRIKTENFEELKELQRLYKAEIGEEAPTTENYECLKIAIDKNSILFYGCLCEARLVACCSVSLTYSTFNYQKSGVFEDFYIFPEYRHKGIARKLVAFAFEQSEIGSLSVGCADCDVKMYNALGFSIPLGNMFAFDN